MLPSVMRRLLLFLLGPYSKLVYLVATRTRAKVAIGYVEFLHAKRAIQILVVRNHGCVKMIKRRSRRTCVCKNERECGERKDKEKDSVNKKSVRVRNKVKRVCLCVVCICVRERESKRVRVSERKKERIV